MPCSSEAGTAHSTVRTQTFSQTLQLLNVNNALLDNLEYKSSMYSITYTLARDG